MIDIEIINNNKDYKSQYLTLEKGTTIQELVNNVLKLEDTNEEMKKDIQKKLIYGSDKLNL